MAKASCEMTKRDEAKVRRWDMMRRVGKSRHLSFEELVREFGGGVSEQTIRNDLKAIAKLPKLTRHPGTKGLTERRESLLDLFKGTYFERSSRANKEEKQAIARALIDPLPSVADPTVRASLIDLDGDSVVVGPGTTTLEVLRLLAFYDSVQILTCNIGVLTEPNAMTDSVHLSGGWLLRSIGCLVGLEAARCIESFVADTAIIGVSGLFLDEGAGDVTLFCHHEVQLPVKRALITSRRKVIVVTCGEKIGKRDAWTFAGANKILREADFYLVTDKLPEGCAPQLQKWFSRPPSKNGHGPRLVLTEKEKI